MKKIIAIAVASAFVAPSVLAEVVVYGVAAPSVEYSKISDTTSSDLTRFRLVDNLSRIGFKGTDKLDNGLKLFWQVENRVYIGSGEQSGGFNTRDSWVGVEGNLGRVFVGTAVYDLMFQSRAEYLNGLQNFNETVNGVHTLVNQSQARLSNVAQYTSPVFLGGAQVKALYDFGAKTSAGNYQGFQATATYKFNLLKVGGTYKQNNDTSNVGQQTPALSGTVTPVAEAFLKSYLVGATLSPIAGVDISAMWDRTKKKASVSAAEIRQDAWAIGAHYTTGKHVFGAHYGKIGNQKNMSTGNTTDDTGAYLVVGQYKYALSKQTYLHASVGYTKNDKLATYNMGTTKVTDATAGPVAVPGMKVTTIATGVTTSF